MLVVAVGTILIDEVTFEVIPIVLADSEAVSSIDAKGSGLLLLEENSI